MPQVEMGSKNHEVVPSQLVAELSQIRGGNVKKALGDLAKRNLVARVQNVKCMYAMPLYCCSVLTPSLSNLEQMMDSG